MNSWPNVFSSKRIKPTRRAFSLTLASNSHPKDFRLANQVNTSSNRPQ